MEMRSRDRKNIRLASAQPTKNTGPTSGNGSSLPPGGDGRSGTSSRGTSWLRPLAVAAAMLAAAVVAYFTFAGGGDPVSQQQKQQRMAGYQTLIASGTGFPVRLVGAQELDKAFASMPDTIPNEAREKMRQEVNQGRLQLAWVTIWDTQVEDGDVVRFESSASIPVEVMALKTKTTLAIPYPSDGQIIVTGVKDGGGGITVALESGRSSIDWPTMAPGDKLKLPVSPSF